MSSLLARCESKRATRCLYYAYVPTCIRIGYVYVYVYVYDCTYGKSMDIVEQSQVLRFASVQCTMYIVRVGTCVAALAFL